MTSNRRPWAPEERDLLRKLWSPEINADPKALDWAAVERIAKQMNRQPGAVYQRARDMGLLGQRIVRYGAGAAAFEAARALNNLPPEHRNGLLSAANESGNRVPALTDFTGAISGPPGRAWEGR